MSNAAKSITPEFDWNNPDYLPVLVDRDRRINAIRKDPDLLIAAKIHYAQSQSGIIDFVEDWLFTYDPRLNKPGEVKTIPFMLWDKQREYLLWLKKLYDDRDDGLLEKSRDQGATWLNLAFAVWLWLFVDEVKIGFGSRKELLVDRIGDPDSIFEKGRMLLRNLPEEILPRGFNIDKHAPSLKIINPENGSIIAGESGDQIGRGGRSSIFFKDESAFYERPERIDSALSQNSDCKIDVSTPNGPGNPFYKKRHSGKIPVFTLHWMDDPRKDQAWYDKECDRLDDVIVAQEIDIDYHASAEGAVIPAKWVRAAVNFEMEASGRKRGGLDVADEGGDLNALVMGHGSVVTDIDTWKKGNTTQTTRKAHLKCKIKDIEDVNFDSIGVGAGVKGESAEISKKIKEETGQADPITFHPIHTGESPTSGEYAKGKKNIDMFLNYRAQLWWEARRRFEKTYEHVNKIKEHDLDELISIPNHPELIAELSQPKFEIGPSGKIKIESKDHMRARGVKSPNIADALVLFLADKGIYSTVASIARRKAGRRR